MAKKKLVKSEFGRNVLTLMTGSTIAQFIPLALTPVLTRMFSPEEFGLFALYLSLITFLAAVSTGRYEQAIVLPKSQKESINVVGVSFLFLFGTMLLFYLVLWIFYKPITGLLDVPALNWWLWLLPLAVFFTGTYRVLTFWSNRNKRFKGTSSAVMVQSFGRIGVQLPGGYLGHTSTKSFFPKIKEILAAEKSPSGVTNYGVGSLVLSYIVGIVLACLFLVYPLVRHDWKLIKNISKNEMKKQAGIYSKFPKINMLHALSDEVKNFGVNALILGIFSKTILGLFSMTTRILRTPLAIIGTSFGQVFYQKAAEMHSHEQNFIPLIKSTVKKMLIISIPIFTIVMCFGPWLFEFVLGEKWREAGVYAQYLTPWLMVSFIINPVLQVSVILQKQGEYFVISLIHNAIIIGSILLGGLVFFDLTTGFIFLSSFQVIFYLLVFRWVMSISRSAVAGYSTSTNN